MARCPNNTKVMMSDYKSAVSLSMSFSIICLHASRESVKMIAVSSVSWGLCGVKASWYLMALVMALSSIPAVLILALLFANASCSRMKAPVQDYGATLTLRFKRVPWKV